MHFFKVCIFDVGLSDCFYLIDELLLLLLLALLVRFVKWLNKKDLHYEWTSFFLSTPNFV